MRQHHRVNEPDARCDRHGDQVRDCRADAAPEEDRGRRGHRDLETLVEPQRQQRLHEKPGAEGIHAEQRGEPVNKPLGLAQWLVGCRFRLDCRRQRPVQHQRDEPEHGIADKHQLHDGEAADAPIRG